MFDLSLGQKTAFEAVEKWFTEQDKILQGDLLGNDDLGSVEMTKPIFRLFGYAGTGKTTIIRILMTKLGMKPGEVRFAAYTGKAAMVMRKTGLDAQTIHSLIYEPVAPNQAECNKLAAAIKDETDPTQKQVLKGELKEKSKVHFIKRSKSNSALRRTRLLVLDECSMVNDTMLGDLLTFHVPMLVLGDPGQLPPIEGEGALTKEKPDVMLTEIHRQAAGNPIIDFATRARNKIFIPKIQLGNSLHTSQTSLSSEQVLGFSQIICGKNLTKQRLNQRIRGLRGYEGIYPVVGEKLICLKNNAEDYLFNGLMCEVLEVGELLDNSIQLRIRRETDGEEAEGDWVNALRAHFEAYQDKEALENVKWWERDGTNEFDYGYAITVHKAQGSQWENVLLWDDKMFVGWNSKDRSKWLYTGITRAIETITIASMT